MRFRFLLAIFLSAGISNGPLLYGKAEKSTTSACVLHILPNGYIQYHHEISVHITARIQRSTFNRNATLVLSSEEGEAYERASGFEIEGNEAPTVWNFDYRGLDSGTYVAVMTVQQLKGGKWSEFSCQSEKLTVLE